MDYLERKYKGKRKEKILNIVYLVVTFSTLVAAGLLIFGFLKKEIVDKKVLFFATFFLAFIMCVLLAVKSKMAHRYERIVWLVIEAIVLLVLSIISLLILV